jgi:tRNA-dihydrouridine synthase B
MNLDHQKTFKIGKIKMDNPLSQAPMCNITHKPFRKLCKKFGAGLLYTQMVSAKAIVMGDQKSRKLLEYDESERPIAFQVFGNNPKDLSESAKILQDMGPDILDLNMGCPAKKIVNDGGGSALLKDTKLSTEIFKGMRKALTIPFTIKVRAGWDKEHQNALDLVRIAENEGIDAVSLHARTKAQGYSGSSDWDLIQSFKEELKIPVIGNGDVLNYEDAYRMLSKTKCDGVMIGRGGVSTPWIFQNYLQKEEWNPDFLELKEIIFSQYQESFNYYGPVNGIKQMRKHLCAYTKGIRDGSKFRNQVLRIDNWDEIKNTINNFFDEASRYQH